MRQLVIVIAAIVFIADGVFSSAYAPPGGWGPECKLIPSQEKCKLWRRPPPCKLIPSQERCKFWGAYRLRHRDGHRARAARQAQ
jgi:hypothetical protein